MSATLPLRRGMVNGAVINWQTTLNTYRSADKLALYSNLQCDGVFGEHTEMTTRIVQLRLKLPQTGQVDQATLDAVTDAVGRYNATMDQCIAETPTPPLQALPDRADSIVRHYFSVDHDLPRDGKSDSLIGLGARGVLLGHGFLDIESDDDIDADGKNASHAEDPNEEGDTSLHWPDGSACDSHTFCGFVLPGRWYQRLGINIGDYGLVWFNGLWTPAQFYDVGPRSKIGETSIATTLALKQPASPTRGNSITTLRTIVFSGSGPGHAVDTATQRAEVEKLIGRLA